MKFTRINISALVIISMGILFSCRDDDWSPAPDWNDNVGAATKIILSSTDKSFKLSDGINNEFIEFNLDVDGYGVTTVASVELQLTYTKASPAKVVGPVLLKTIESFPSVVRVTSQEVAAAVGGGVTPNNFLKGDSFKLTFPIVTTDGRRLTVAPNSDLCVQPAQPLFGSCQVQWVVEN